jgi:AmpD protein
LIDIAGHSEIAPGRKTDPGPYFDWNRVQARLTP